MIKNKCKGNISGFTLIELLVVVLIIGILSAVAMPQYTKAVEKARVSEAKTLLKSLNDAEEVYALSNGSHTYDLSSLDISFPGSYSEDRERVTTKYFEIRPDECGVCGNKGSAFCCDMYADRIGKNYSVRLLADNYDAGYDEEKSGVFYCVDINGNGGEDEICPKVGATKNADGLWVF